MALFNSARQLRKAIAAERKLRLKREVHAYRLEKGLRKGRIAEIQARAGIVKRTSLGWATEPAITAAATTKIATAPFRAIGTTGIVAAIIVIAIVVFLLMRKR